jgi:hypothetical protein
LPLQDLPADSTGEKQVVPVRAIPAMATRALSFKTASGYLRCAYM